MLLLGASAAAGLASVWMLAGLSEKSALKPTPRALSALALGWAVDAVFYFRIPESVRGDLALPLLFAFVSVLSLAVGAGKLDAALAERNGPRVVRRAAGIVAGALFGIVAVGAASLDLGRTALALSRVGWTLMFGLVLATLLVFVARARYAGAGLLSLGSRALVPCLSVLALLYAARHAAASPSALSLRQQTVTATQPARATESLGEAQTTPAASVALASTPAAPAASSIAETPPAPSAAAPPVASGESASPHAAVAAPGPISIDALTAHGMFEADARGGVERRKDRLEACVAAAQDPHAGTLALKVGVDVSGSVTYSRVTGGELAGTPLATCLLSVFYKMGFAATSSSGGHFQITLRVPGG